MRFKVDSMTKILCSRKNISYCSRMPRIRIFGLFCWSIDTYII